MLLTAATAAAAAAFCLADAFGGGFAFWPDEEEYEA